MPAFCQHCTAILPLPQPRPDHFALLSAPRRFSQDLVALERTYKDAARAAHPDKFARADALARRAAMQRTIALNEAWRTLREPVARAEYLVRLYGIDVGSEDGTVRHGQAGAEKIPVPSALLTEILEKREALMEARLEDDEDGVRALMTDVRSSCDAALERAAQALDAEPPQTEAAAADLVAVRYYRRFLESSEEGAGAPGAHHG